MQIGHAGRPTPATGHWAGHVLIAGGVGIALAAYCRAGKGREGVAAAHRALKDSFPEAHGRSLAAVMRVVREGQAACRTMRRSKRGACPATVPDARPLIRKARREH